MGSSKQREVPSHASPRMDSSTLTHLPTTARRRQAGCVRRVPPDLMGVQCCVVDEATMCSELVSSSDAAASFSGVVRSSVASAIEQSASILVNKMSLCV